MKILPFILIPFLIIGCFGNQNTKPVTKNHSKINKYEILLQEGIQKLSIGEFDKAIESYFNPIIDYYTKTYENNDKHKYYSARGEIDALHYLLLTMTATATEKNKIIIISKLWADAFYYKSYASLELHNSIDAKIFIEKAIKLSPVNAGYLSELGHIYQLNKDWDMAINTFKKAEEVAITYSPEEIKISELLRAKRGIAYNLVELGMLNRAEDKYLECIKIDKNDIRSLEELKYIRNLRSKSKAVISNKKINSNIMYKIFKEKNKVLFFTKFINLSAENSIKNV